jgi:hypothetical protein
MPVNFMRSFFVPIIMVLLSSCSPELEEDFRSSYVCNFLGLELENRDSWTIKEDNYGLHVISDGVDVLISNENIPSRSNAKACCMESMENAKFRNSDMKIWETSPIKIDGYDGYLGVVKFNVKEPPRPGDTLAYGIWANSIFDHLGYSIHAKCSNEDYPAAKKLVETVASGIKFFEQNFPLTPEERIQLEVFGISFLNKMKQGDLKLLKEFRIPAMELYEEIKLNIRDVKDRDGICDWIKSDFRSFESFILESFDQSIDQMMNFGKEHEVDWEKIEYVKFEYKTMNKKPDLKEVGGLLTFKEKGRLFSIAFSFLIKTNGKWYSEYGDIRIDTYENWRKWKNQNFFQDYRIAKTESLPKTRPSGQSNQFIVYVITPPTSPSTFFYMNPIQEAAGHSSMSHGCY